MNIIISPAKKMNNREDELDFADLPCFLSKAEVLKEYIRGLSLEEARALWVCNEAIARLNYDRFQDMNLRKRLTPALLSYEGIQYQYMAPGVFETRHWEYVQRHLRILSGFYGILRPLDGIVPYRLEMQARIRLTPDCPEDKEEAGLAEGSDRMEITSLYEYWGNSLYEELVKEDKVVVNLASKEYSKAIEPFLTPDITYLTCVFGTWETDKKGNPRVKVKATEAKMARGEMVRFMAEHEVSEPEELKGFDSLDYRYHEELSDEREFVFLKETRSI